MIRRLEKGSLDGNPLPLIGIGGAIILVFVIAMVPRAKAAHLRAQQIIAEEQQPTLADLWEAFNNPPADMINEQEDPNCNKWAEECDAGNKDACRCWCALCLDKNCERKTP